MSLQLKLVENKTQWEAFVTSRPESNFLQSWNWGQFEISLGKKVFYLGLFQGENLVGVCLATKEPAKRGPYLAIAGGPLIDFQSNKQKNLLFSHLETLAKKEGCWFIRLRPQLLKSTGNAKTFKTLGYKPSPMHMTADLTIELDLSLSQEELLAKMRKNTRYEIKKSTKLNVEVVQSNNPEDIQEFHHHQVNLAKKHRFVPFSLKFFSKQFQAFSSDNQVSLFHSYQGKKLLASAFVIFYAGEAAYHYGISTPDNHRLPGSYAALWAAILEAKKRGLARFNLWGVAPEKAIGHRFYGVRIFKTGFGGQEVAYLPAMDKPTSPLYWLTYFFEKLRASRRHLA